MGQHLVDRMSPAAAGQFGKVAARLAGPGPGPTDPTDATDPTDPTPWSR